MMLMMLSQELMEVMSSHRPGQSAGRVPQVQPQSHAPASGSIDVPQEVQDGLHACVCGHTSC